MSQTTDARRRGRWSPTDALKGLGRAAALLLLLATTSHPSRAQQQADALNPLLTALPIETLLQTLTKNSVTLVDKAGNKLGQSQLVHLPPKLITDVSVIASLRDSQPTPEQVGKLWEIFADKFNTSLITLPIVVALLAVSNKPQARDALWSALAALAGNTKLVKDPAARAQSLLGFFERHRNMLRPQFTAIRDTESAGYEMVELMLKSKVFGASFDKSLTWVGEHNPAALARRIERERGRGSPVRWEDKAFKLMLLWTKQRLSPGAPKAPGSLAELDKAGETFITIFNNLYPLNWRYREKLLNELGPEEAYNAVIGGEHELYRLGTSSYRGFLHKVIMRGIKKSGSFETFLKEATPNRFGGELQGAAQQRGMVFLRVVSSFGLLEKILDTVRDRESFIQETIAHLGDRDNFERNSSVIMDLLTTRHKTKAAKAFKTALRKRLYEYYREKDDTRMWNVYGSILSAYQTVTGDRRLHSIDREFPLSDSIFRIPFDRLFSRLGREKFIHRMLMVMEADTDSKNTYGSFQAKMKQKGASLHAGPHFIMYRFKKRRRIVEIYVNKPTDLGVSRGITNIAAELQGKRIETVIGRGHTSIIGSVQKQAKQVLGNRMGEIATVFVGTCGGDASTRQLIDTFGYVAILTTRSTGRRVINNEIIWKYTKSLLSLRRRDRLSIARVLKKGIKKYMKRGVRKKLREDASFYRVSAAAVLAAFLFDRHIQRAAIIDGQIAGN